MGVFSNIKAFFKVKPKSAGHLSGYTAFDSQFRQQVDTLSYNKQLDFAITVCEMLLPDYQVFHQAEQWGDPVVLMDAINICQRARTNSIDKAIIEEMTLKVEAVTPDTDDFGDGSYALNACVAVCECLQFLLDKAPSHIYYVGISYYDTIDFKVQEDNELEEEEIDSHPLMVEAKSFLINQTKS